MADGGKSTHVAAELGDDDLGRAARDPGNRVEPCEGVGISHGERRDVQTPPGFPAWHRRP
jgi:hypothetical protein